VNSVSPDLYWPGSKFPSPSRILAAFPVTKALIRAYALVLGLFAIFEIGLHVGSESLFSWWLNETASLTRLMAFFVVAIDQLNIYLSNTNHYERIPVLSNLIAFYWLISIFFVVGGAIAVAYDLKHQKLLARVILEKMEKSNRSPGLMLLGYLFMASVVFFLIYTRIGYAAMFALYASDIGFFVIAWLFYAVVVNLLLFEVMLIALMRSERTNDD
jgi:hypothetical protein